jgi:hypothetical protein
VLTSLAAPSHVRPAARIQSVDIVVALTWARYGAAPFLWLPPPTLGTPREAFPPDYGCSLWVTYAVWFAVLVVLSPLCLWFARMKARRRAWWLSYL